MEICYDNYLQLHPMPSVFYITITDADGDYTADKTMAQVTEAVVSGCPAYCIFTGTEYGSGCEEVLPPFVCHPEDFAVFGIYNSKGNRVGFIQLGCLVEKGTGSKLYSFGALSDIRIGESTAEDDYKRVLAWLSQNVDFICKCGDLIHGGTGKEADQIEQYKMCRAAEAVPVYAIA